LSKRPEKQQFNSIAAVETKSKSSQERQRLEDIPQKLNSIDRIGIDGLVRDRERPRPQS